MWLTLAAAPLLLNTVDVSAVPAAEALKRGRLARNPAGMASAAWQVELVPKRLLIQERPRPARATGSTHQRIPYSSHACLPPRPPPAANRPPAQPCQASAACMKMAGLQEQAVFYEPLDAHGCMMSAKRFSGHAGRRRGAHHARLVPPVTVRHHSLVACHSFEIRFKLVGTHQQRHIRCATHLKQGRSVPLPTQRQLAAACEMQITQRADQTCRTDKGSYCKY